MRRRRSSSWDVGTHVRFWDAAAAALAARAAALRSFKNVEGTMRFRPQPQRDEICTFKSVFESAHPTPVEMAAWSSDARPANLGAEREISMRSR